MPRRPRIDQPGQWHHVMNRGIARRTVFETDADARYFLACLAREVRAKLLEVHAFCVLTTHFHLLVRCPQGDLGGTMRRVLNAFVRHFNRTRSRDGALFRGRFRSRPVTTESYRRILVRYIDFNSVQAGLVRNPIDFPHGSAGRHVRATGTPWLERSWVRSRIISAGWPDNVDPVSYAAVFGGRPGKDVVRLVERRLENPATERDPLDDLLTAAPDVVRSWMMRKAALADGTQIGIAACDPLAIRSTVARVRADRPLGLPTSPRKGRRADPWLQIENALLRELANLRGRECGLLLGRSATWSWRSHEKHRAAMSDPTYAEVVTQITIRSQAPLVNPVQLGDKNAPDQIH